MHSCAFAVQFLLLCLLPALLSIATSNFNIIYLLVDKLATLNYYFDCDLFSCR